MKNVEKIMKYVTNKTPILCAWSKSQKEHRPLMFVICLKNIFRLLLDDKIE